MMTPKDKAIELVKKMHPNKMWTATDWKEAKRCALIAVDEILDFQYRLFITKKTLSYKYWEEVKQEIKGL